VALSPRQVAKISTVEVHDAVLRGVCAGPPLYGPGRHLPTTTGEAAQRAGSIVIGGLPMLVDQTAQQIELRTGRAPALLAAMREAGAVGDDTVRCKRDQP
jgi:hypothetical protein